MNKKYEVLIVGGGISGAALSYELARYTDISSIAVVEKYDGIGLLNTAGTSNSQTIHFGDIETNYTLSKAAITKKTAKMVEKYCLQYNYENEIIFSHQKMALGIGDDEAEFMLERFEEFGELFPYLHVWDKEHLKELEPRLVYDEHGNEREETIVGIGAKDQWTTVDYGKMANSLIHNAKEQDNTEVDLFLNSKVVDIKQLEDKSFEIKTKDKTFYADFVVVDAGAHSLYIAHQMGYGLDYSTLPMAGSFYLTKEHLLNGKVYMVQNPKLPFAALHGDPDILADQNTRFGPTALVLPKLERYRGNSTVIDFFKTLRFDTKIVRIFWDLLKDSDIRNYIFRNFLYEIPWINRRLFVKEARKIVPSLRVDEIEYAEGFGGVRPQVINKKEKKLMLGEASINTEKGIVFNMTPSPGATSCLGNALRDVKIITKYMNKKFDEELFNSELLDHDAHYEPSEHIRDKEYVSQIRKEIHEHEQKHFGEHHTTLVEYWDRLIHR